MAAGSLLKLPQNCILLGTQGGLYKIGDYCFNDGDPDAVRRLIPHAKPVTWEKQPLGQMLITTDGTDAPVEFEPREVLARVLKRLARHRHPAGRRVRARVLPVRRAARGGMPKYPRDRLSDDRDDQPNMHIERLSRFSDVLHEMVDVACVQGIDATVITAEPTSSKSISAIATTGCARRLVGDVLPLRTRGVALQHGYRASFMGKPYLHAPGSGMHAREPPTMRAQPARGGRARPLARTPAASRCCRIACRRITMRSGATDRW